MTPIKIWGNFVETFRINKKWPIFTFSYFIAEKIPDLKNAKNINLN
jgi:hypothetical protein